MLQKEGENGRLVRKYELNIANHNVDMNKKMLMPVMQP